MALFSSLQIDTFETGRFQIVDLLEIDLWNKSTQSYDINYKFSTQPMDRLFISDSGPATYLGGFLIDITGTATNEQMNRKGITFQLAGLSQALINYVYDNTYNGAPFTYSKAVLDNSSSQVGNTVIVYKGIIDSGGFTTSADSGAIIVLNGSHTLYNFTRKNQIYTQHDAYVSWCKRNGLTGYSNEFVDIDIPIGVNWGKK